MKRNLQRRRKAALKPHQILRQKKNTDFGHDSMFLRARSAMQEKKRLDSMFLVAVTLPSAADGK